MHQVWLLFLIAAAAIWISIALSYTRPSTSSRHSSDVVCRSHRCIPVMTKDQDVHSDRSRYLHRCRSAAVSLLPLVASLCSPSIGYARLTPAPPPFPSRGFQTKSGLKVRKLQSTHKVSLAYATPCSQYFDFNNITEGPTPRYGQFVSLYYSMFYRPGGGTTQLELIDATVDNQPYLQKHGRCSSFADTTCTKTR